LSRPHIFLPALISAALAAARAHAAPPFVSVHDARVVEGDTGASQLVFEVVANGLPRRLQLAYSLTDLTASAAGGDYSPAPGVVMIEPEPARLVEHWGAGSFVIPRALALAPNGDVIAVDGPNCRIHRFSRDGTLLQTFGVNGSGDGQLLAPTGVAVGPGGEIFVVDFSNRVSVFSPSGLFQRSWGSLGAGPGQFDLPYEIAVSASGSVYVSDGYNNRIQQFTTSGMFVQMWSTATPGEPAFDHPLGIAVDAAGVVYVAKGMSGRILKFAPDGSLLATWTDTKGLCRGGGLHLDSFGNLLIADHYAARVVVLDPQGAFLAEWMLDEGPEQNATEFAATGIVADQLGNVYVGSRYSASIAHFRWDRASGAIAVPVAGDTSFEPNETLEVRLSGTSGVWLQDGTAIGTIANDDSELGPDLVTNGRFNVTLAGWTPHGGGALGLSPNGRDGPNAARAVSESTLVCGINDSPSLVPSTPIGARYRYSAWVRSAGVGAAHLRVREYLGGLQQAKTESLPLAFDGSWQRIDMTVHTVTEGGNLDFQVVGEFAAIGQEFLIDDVAVHVLGADVPPVVDVDATVAGNWMREVVVEVSARDPESEPIDSLEADLSRLPGATFTVDPDHSRGTLRWSPSIEDVRDDPYLVTFTARNGAVTSATSRIRIGPNVVLNSSFEEDTSGWRGHVGSTMARVPGGRRDGFAARLTLPVIDWAGVEDNPSWASSTGFGRRFVIGAWVRAETNHGSVRMQVREYEGGIKVGTSTVIGPPEDLQLASSWRRVLLSHTCVAQGPSELDLTIDAQGLGGGTFDVDDVSIVCSGRAYSLDAPGAVPPPLAARVVPNPARGRATLELSVPAAGRLKVELYDLSGRRRAVIVDEAGAEAGVRRFGLEPHDGRLGPGVYWYRAVTASGTRQGRFVVLE